MFRCAVSVYPEGSAAVFCCREFLYMLDTSVAYYTDATVVDVRGTGGNCVVERLVHNRRRSSFSQPERPRNVFSAPRPLAPSDADKTKTFFSSPVHHERKRLYTSTDASSSGKEENKKEMNGKKIKKQNKTRR